MQKKRMQKKRRNKERVPVVDYSFYTDDYCGNMSEDEFKRYSAAATAFVRQVIFNRELPKDAGDRAICAVADVMKRGEDCAGVSREENDGIAVTYAGTSSAEVAAECYRAAAVYLGGTGLMYRGVGGAEC